MYIQIYFSLANLCLGLLPLQTQASNDSACLLCLFPFSIFFQRLAAGHLKQKGPLSLTWGATRKLGARQTISDPGVSLGEGCQKEVECLAVDFNVTEMTVIAFAANIYCILTTEFSRRNKSRPRARGPRDHMDRKKKTSRGTGLHSRKRPCPGVGRLDLILSLPLTW